MSDTAPATRHRRRRHAALLASLCAGGVLVAAGAEELPDPTRPPMLHEVAKRRLEAPPRRDYTVSAIKISEVARKALVNGRLVAEGDRIGETRIVEIAPDGVVVEYLAERRRLTLLPQVVRRGTAASSPRE